MTKFVVTEKKSLVKNTIDNSQVILKAAAIVQVNLHREDVAEFIQDGNNLILKLQNGDVITIQNFFVQYEDKIVSDLVFEDNEAQIEFLKYQLGNEFDSELFINPYNQYINMCNILIDNVEYVIIKNKEDLKSFLN